VAAVSELSSPPGTVSCMLCRGVVAYRGGDTTRFNNHMNYEHGAYFDIDFLLAACLMNNEERDAVRNVMSDKMRVESPAPSEQQQPIPPLFIQDPSIPLSHSATSKPSSSKLKNSTPQKRKFNEVFSTKEEAVTEEVIIKKEKKSEEVEVNQKIRFECGECDKTYPTRKSLQNHQHRKGHGSKGRSAGPSTSLVKKEDPIDQDILEKVATLDELSSSETSSESDFKTLISTASAEDAIKTLIGLSGAGEDDYEEDADDPLDCNPLEISDSEEKEDEAEVDCSESAYFRANPHTVGKTTDKGLSEDQFNTIDNKLPDGWKVKETINVLKNGRKDKKREYLTKDKKVLKTGLAVLEFMRITEKFTAQEIIAVAKHISVPFTKVEKYILSL